MKRDWRLRFINFWPPFLGAGIRIKSISPDFQHVAVEMKMRFWNKNYVGSHYGGSLYSMTDPFYMLMLMHNLGRDYIVWDKAADIRFLKPGYGCLTAQFDLTPARIAGIKKDADENYKTEPRFLVDIRNEEGDAVAAVEKVLYIRRKDRKKKEDLP